MRLWFVLSRSQKRDLVHPKFVVLMMSHEVPVLVRLDGEASAHAHMQSHSLPRFRVHLKHSRSVFYADGLRLGVHSPILRNGVTDDEDGGFVGNILHQVFLLGDPDKEARTLAFADLFFDVMARRHAFKMTDGIIAKGVIMVAHHGRVGIGQDLTRSVNRDLQAGLLVLILARRRGQKSNRKDKWENRECLCADHGKKYKGKSGICM